MKIQIYKWLRGFLWRSREDWQHCKILPLCKIATTPLLLFLSCSANVTCKVLGGNYGNGIPIQEWIILIFWFSWRFLSPSPRDRMVVILIWFSLWMLIILSFSYVTILRSGWTRSWRRRASARRSWRSWRLLLYRYPPPPSPSPPPTSPPPSYLLSLLYLYLYLYFLPRLSEWVTSRGCKVSPNKWNSVTPNSRTCSERGTTTNDFWGELSYPVADHVQGEEVGVSYHLSCKNTKHVFFEQCLALDYPPHLQSPSLLLVKDNIVHSWNNSNINWLVVFWKGSDGQKSVVFHEF